MKKKVLSVLLVAAMTASMVAGCGSSNEAANNDAAETPADDAAEAPADDAAEAPADDAEAPADDAAADPVANLVAATEGPVDITVWCSELEAWQTVMNSLTESFAAQYPDVEFNFTVGSESESKCKDDVLADVEAAADVFVFADDQLNELVAAGALQSLDMTYTYNPTEAFAEGTLAAASKDGKLYAYPITASNGYFLYYDSSVFSADDVASWENLVAAAEANGVNVGMTFSDAWYLYSFFAGAGCDMQLTDDGVTNSCDWNGETGVAVANSIMNICKSDAVLNLTNAEATEQAKNGSLKAFVDGTWDVSAFEEAYGDGYAATKLPTFDVNGTATQQGSFAGYKLVGVNAYSKNPAWSMIFAEYITNEANQLAIGQATNEGPANVVAGSQLDSPALAALSAQSAYADLQRVGGSYWDPAATLGATLFAGTDDVQGALDQAVEGITATPAE